jgi:hypothetical protein
VGDVELPGPAPTITTGTFMDRSAMDRSAAAIALLRFLLGLAEALDGQDPGRVDDRAGVGEGLDQGPQPGRTLAAEVGVGLAGARPLLEGSGAGGLGGDQVAHGGSLSEIRLSLAPCAGALTWR